MCGISGIINFNSVTCNANALVNMTQSMINRGPDDEGYILVDDRINNYIGDNSISKEFSHIQNNLQKSFRIGFGFRQLKIIDLSNKSHQPMVDESNAYCIVFNGEVYNYKELRNQLISLGHTFRSQSDSEVVLKSYIEWGEKALHKFNGMFGLAIYDLRKKIVFIARDRIGIKPIYFYPNKEFLIFASTQKAIIDSELYQKEINWEGLSQNFRYSIAQRPVTCFKNIYALEPGHYLSIDLNRNQSKKIKYWNIPTNSIDFEINEKVASKLIDEALYEAVKLRLNADVEVGTFMSGGIDSSLIAILASKMKPNIKALTLGFNNYKELNEIEPAMETAKLHSLNHIISHADSADIIKHINKTAIAYEEPYHDLSANYFLVQMARQNNVKVVLSGLGGDELFGGYDVYNKLKYWNHLKSQRAIINRVSTINNKFNRIKSIANYDNEIEFYAHYYSTFNDKEIKTLFKSNYYETNSTLSNLYNYSDMNFANSFDKISYYNLKSYIGNHQMRTLDQFTMHFSIEGRFPLLDHNFIELAYRIPPRLKLKWNTQKYILKQVASKYVGKKVMSMKKKGLILPLKYWINSRLREFTNDTVNDLKTRCIFNNDNLDTILHSNDEKKIWQLVSTEIWLKNFFD
ncbi:asparagine synthase (glutamine-hydrolyzing) [Urechidicola sp. KH5]